MRGNIQAKNKKEKLLKHNSTADEDRKVKAKADYGREDSTSAVQLR